jgi:murein DD-endopeptidase MepM/ murein hydrolase activator NlpD
MTLKTAINNTVQTLIAMPAQARAFATRSPLLAAGLLMATGMVVGAGARSGIGMVEVERAKATAAAQQAEVEEIRAGAQREINALAARMGELQAQATRLNALGERLTRVGQLADGEFDFDRAVGVGGAGKVEDMPPAELASDLAALEGQYTAAGQQLSVLESLLFSRELDRNATPSRAPIADSYVTSAYGMRSDPMRGGRQYHKGIDFEADTGDAVLSVADGVVSFAGVRSGYGNVVEVDHGNGYVTRYAHNSRLTRRVGDLVRRGQEIAKAGSTGRSTGPHVHFEVWENGVAVNPSRFLGDGRG